MVIFGTGVVTGGLLVQHTRIVKPPRAVHTPPTQRPTALGTPSGMRLELLRRMQRELDLTAEQRERIDRILKESQDQIRKITAPVAPEIRQELQRTLESFRGVLTPEQRQRFEELIKQQQRPREPRKAKGGQPGAVGAEGTNFPAK